MREIIPPFSLNAEKSVLGCMLLDEYGANMATGLLKGIHFHVPEHRDAFDVMTSQLNSDVQPDIVTTAVALAKRGVMTEDEAGILLLGCLETVPYSAHVASYASDVLRLSQRRNGINALRSAYGKFADQTTDTVEVMSDAVDGLQTAIGDGIVDSPQTAAVALADALTSVDVARVPTGFVEVDQLTGGLSPKTLTVLGARPSVGKTALAIEIGRRMTCLGVSVLLFSVEMTRQAIGQRLGAMTVGLPFASIRDRRMSHEDQLCLKELQSADWMQRFLIDEQPRTVDEMTAIARLYARRFGVKVVLVDYLQLVPTTNTRQPREQQVSEISRKLKGMAKSANVAVLCLAQLNRDIEKRDQKKPKLSDLRESGSIEQDADQVWMLWRPNKDTDATDDHGELIVAKSRNGQCGTVRLAWNGPTMTYGDAFSEAEFASEADEWETLPR